MSDIYSDIQKIRRGDSNIIMVANQKLVNHTGSFDSAEIQALIGKAIKNKLLKFSLGSDADSFVQKAKK